MAGDKVREARTAERWWSACLRCCILLGPLRNWCTAPRHCLRSESPWVLWRRLGFARRPLVVMVELLELNRRGIAGRPVESLAVPPVDPSAVASSTCSDVASLCATTGPLSAKAINAEQIHLICTVPELTRRGQTRRPLGRAPGLAKPWDQLAAALAFSVSSAATNSPSMLIWTAAYSATSAHAASQAQISRWSNCAAFSRRIFALASGLISRRSNSSRRRPGLRNG